MDTPEQIAINKASSALHRGDVFRAHDLASAAMRDYPNSTELQIISALSLSKTGAISAAIKALQPILASKAVNFGSNENLYHDLADTLISVWRHTNEIQYRDQAADILARGFASTERLGLKIRSQIVGVLGDENPTNFNLALAIEKSFDDSKLNPDETLMLALVRGDQEKATGLAQYIRSRYAGNSGDFRVLISRIAELKQSGIAIPQEVDAVLQPPAIVVFAGHNFDHPSGDRHLPLHYGDALRRHIDERLDELDASIGYTTLSAGSSLIFAEALLERQAELNIVLPFCIEDLIEQDVAYAGEDITLRVRNVIDTAHTVTFATDGPFLGHKMLYRYANQILHGISLLRGGFLGTPPYLLAVWDHSEGTLTGGAADFIDHWGDIARIRLIDPDLIGFELEENDPPEIKTALALPDEEIIGQVTDLQRVLRVMLFCDLMHFSKLDDADIPRFIYMLKTVEEQISRKYKPLMLSTWGDAIFLVMNDAMELAALALDLAKWIEDAGSTDKGFPHALKIRTSLHAGPVYETHDPLTKRLNFWGQAITRTARLEPVTVPGEVYATQPFVALLSSEQAMRESEATQMGEHYHPPFSSVYVGEIALAKAFGKEPIYHLRRSI